LCASENLVDDEKYYAGPNHPAIGEMVESAMLYNKITSLIEKKSSYSDTVLKVFVAKGCLSKAIGQKKTNKNRLIREYGFADVKIVEVESLFGYELMLEEERKRECT
jgi:phosphopantetheinyl transferase (holo-ACP synthase)